MKRIISILVAFVFVFSMAVSTLATENEFNLIEFIENNKIESYSDFVSIIAENSGDVPVSMYTYSLRYLSDKNEEYFNVEIDFDNNTVEVDVIYSPTTNVMATTRSGSAKHETYSAVGSLLYTVTVSGTFNYTSNNCYTTSKSGAFNANSGTAWSSTPTVNSGNITMTKAFARTSGTATCLALSQTYRLTLMCDTSGRITSEFVRP